MASSVPELVVVNTSLLRNSSSEPSPSTASSSSADASEWQAALLCCLAFCMGIGLAMADVYQDRLHAKKKAEKISAWEEERLAFRKELVDGGKLPTREITERSVRAVRMSFILGQDVVHVPKAAAGDDDKDDDDDKAAKAKKRSSARAVDVGLVAGEQQAVRAWIVEQGLLEPGALKRHIDAVGKRGVISSITHDSTGFHADEYRVELIDDDRSHRCCGGPPRVQANELLALETPLERMVLEKYPERDWDEEERDEIAQEPTLVQQLIVFLVFRLPILPFQLLLRAICKRCRKKEKEDDGGGEADNEQQTGDVEEGHGMKDGGSATATTTPAAKAGEKGGAIDLTRLVLFSSRTPDIEDFARMIKCQQSRYEWNTFGVDDLVGLVSKARAANGGKRLTNIAVAGHGPPPSEIQYQDHHKQRRGRRRGGGKCLPLLLHGKSGGGSGGDDDTDDETDDEGEFYWPITLSVVIRDDRELLDRKHPARVLMEALGNAVLPKGEGGRVDLLACSLLRTREGREVFAAIEELTGCDFAASDDVTGNVAAGGDWIMESDNVSIKDTYFKNTDLFDGTFAIKTKASPRPVAVRKDMQIEKTTSERKRSAVEAAVGTNEFKQENEFEIEKETEKERSGGGKGERDEEEAAVVDVETGIIETEVSSVVQQAAPTEERKEIVSTADDVDTLQVAVEEAVESAATLDDVPTIDKQAAAPEQPMKEQEQEKQQQQQEAAAPEIEETAAVSRLSSIEKDPPPRPRLPTEAKGDDDVQRSSASTSVQKTNRSGEEHRRRSQVRGERPLVAEEEDLNQYRGQKDEEELWLRIERTLEEFKERDLAGGSLRSSAALQMMHGGERRTAGQIVRPPPTVRPPPWWEHERGEHGGNVQRSAQQQQQQEQWWSHVPRADPITSAVQEQHARTKLQLSELQRESAAQSALLEAWRSR